MPKPQIEPHPTSLECVTLNGASLPLDVALEVAHGLFSAVLSQVDRQRQARETLDRIPQVLGTLREALEQTKTPDAADQSLPTPIAIVPRDDAYDAPGERGGVSPPVQTKVSHCKTGRTKKTGKSAHPTN